MKIVISINTSWNIYNFRAGLIQALIERGHEVVALAPHDEYSSRLAALGCKYIELPMDNKGTNPIRDALLFFRFLHVLRQEKPDIFLGYTIKPNIYGSLASHFLGIPVINNIAGLGSGFIKNNFLTKLLKNLYKLALRKSHKVFFQNNDDLNFFIDNKIVNKYIVSRIPGSGINLEIFSFNEPVEASADTFAFLLLARLLWDKGIGEYIEAAKLIRQNFPKVKFQLLGFLDVKNPTAISQSQLSQWVENGLIEYLGETDDVKPYLISADCIVLPSYREGVPRTLLEAAAIGRPIVASNVPGCKDVVTHGENGFLCNVRDPNDLADKMEDMMLLSHQRRLEFAIQGRLKIEAEFDENIVIKKYLDVIDCFD